MADDGENIELSEEIMELSKIEKTIDGTGFAYSQLDCVGKRVGTIKVINEYGHLRQINMSKNAIKDVAPIKAIPYILTLNLSSNQIDKIDAWDAEEVLQHLLFLNLSENLLQSLGPLKMPALKIVNLSGNEIATCEAFAGHEAIEELDLSQNMLENLTGVGNMTKLHTMNVARNKLVSLEGMANLPELKTLDLSGNLLETLDGPWREVGNLATLNVSGNLLAVPKPFEAIRALPKLRTLKVSEECGTEPKKNAVADVPDFRHEMLICHWRVDFIDDDEVTEDERKAAEELKEKREEEERARKAAEEAEGAGGDDA